VKAAKLRGEGMGKKVAGEAEIIIRSSSEEEIK
jgi:hypothetical protein